ncbi:MAG: dihydropteroate synthase [Bacteroidales bacterium]|nr:dihydropteroate synthase [Bacteroidales bacterium]
MFTLNIRGRLVTFDRPAVMGILNVTPDSFFSGSRAMSAYDIERRVETMLTQGVDIIDIGACSTRPGADPVSDDEETARLSRGMEIVRRLAPDIPVSVDTFHASVARRAVTTMGCDIVNDISGGTLDDNMAATVADLHCPYILMHMRGTPTTMQTLTEYGDDVTATVISELQRQVRRFEQAGVADIIIDPGFGFAKTVDQNYAVMAGLRRFAIFGRPVLVGISRKSMITKALSIRADEALEATTALNAYALDRGADILRVHDVAAARQAVDIHVRIASASSDR